MISLFYAINNLPAIFAADSSFPLGDIYHQATGSRGGAVGLVTVILLPIVAATVGCYTTAGRMLWSLARDNATPGHETLGRISPQWRNPFAATLACGVVSCVMGGIYVGSTAAFDAFIGAFVILSTASFLAALVPHLLSGRSNIRPGPFWMTGCTGYAVNAVACIYMLVFMVVYCFPYAMPVDAENMNYSSLVTGGLSVFVGAWWLWKRADYVGPLVVIDAVAA